jgi:hypothetical protein
MVTPGRFIACSLALAIAGSLAAQVLVRRGARRPAVTTYDYTFIENFENTGSPGYDTNWTEVGTGTLNENYATNNLQGSECLYINGNGGGFTYTHALINAQDSNHLFFRLLLPDTGGIGVNSRVTLSRVGTADDLGVRIQYGVSAAHYYLAVAHGTVIATNATPVQWDVGTPIWVWAQWHKGSGANGVAKIWASTTPVKPDTVEAETSVGNSTSQPTNVVVVSSGFDRYCVDQIRLSNTQIGSNPN